MFRKVLVLRYYDVMITSLFDFNKLTETSSVTCVTDGPDEIQKMAISALIGIGKKVYERPPVIVY